VIFTTNKYNHTENKFVTKTSDPTGNITIYTIGIHTAVGTATQYCTFH
jgi:hypothetical protein